MQAERREAAGQTKRPLESEIMRVADRMEFDDTSERQSASVGSPAIKRRPLAQAGMPKKIVAAHEALKQPSIRAITLATLVTVLLLFSSVLVPNRAGARLIKIYQHESPPPQASQEHQQQQQATQLAEPAANQSSQVVQAAVAAAAASVSGSSSQPEEVRPFNRLGRSIEFSSPMKRIMELISHHAPVIVVSSSGGAGGGQNNNEQPQPQAAAAAGSTAPSDQQHQWALVNQLAASANMGLPAGQMLMTSQQQLIPATSFQPYAGEQYYLANTNMAAADQQQQQEQPQPQQFAMVPAYGQPPFAQQQFAASYQPIVTNNQQQQQQLMQQQQQQQPANGVEERAQPIFLSSYVPEAFQLMTQPQQPQQQQQQLSLVSSQRPNSIQQQIQQQDNSQQVLAGRGQGQGQPESDSDEPPDSSGKDDSKASGPTETADGQQEHDEPASEGGSSSYEDKYDSDKDEPRSVSSKNHAKTDSTGDGGGGGAGGLANIGLNDDCLQCICRASSGCDHSLRCITRGAEERYCGPFQLTEEYWNKASSPGDESTNFSSFEDCANEVDCAVETVTNYMQKYHKDCDGDDLITCADYARLHRLKPDECADTDELDKHFDAYWAKFQHCAEGYNRSRNGEDESI